MHSLLRSLVFCCIIGFVLPVQGQIWPGDINDNGEVNSVDILYWALANGTDGPLRPNGSLYWQAQAAGADWQQEFPDGQNFTFADCNGDGQVDLVDRIVIELNQDESREPYLGEDFSSGIIGEDPQLWLGESPDQNIETTRGNALQIPVYLGTAERPVENCFGLAFRILLDSGFVNLVNPIVEKEEGDWLFEESALSVLNMDEVFEEEGQEGRELAWHLSDPDETASGFGKIGDLKLIIEDDLTMLQADTTITVRIIPIRMVSNDLTTLKVAEDSLQITIYRDSMALLSNNEESPLSEPLTLSVYPNPTIDQLTIELSAEEINQISVFNVLGQVIQSARLSPGNQMKYLDLRTYPAGRYWLEVITPSGKVVRSDFVKIDSR